MKNFIYRPERPLKEILAFLTGLVSGIFIGQHNCPRPPWDNWGIPEKPQEKPSEEEDNKSKEK